MVEEGRKTKTKKTFLVGKDKNCLISEEEVEERKKTNQTKAMQWQSLTTSHGQTNAQPIPKQKMANLPKSSPLPFVA